MFKAEMDKEKVGRYLDDLIKQRYRSRRDFCREYLRINGEEETDEKINNMSNKITQITKGNKAIQTYDLPFFTELLDVSCEQILSAGECSVPIRSRVTNYSIACSQDPEEWDEYVNRADKLILNSDEYGKTVLDYALEFGNFKFIKYLMENNFIWFDSRRDEDYVQTFGAGTSIKRRDVSHIDYGLEAKLKNEDELRIKLIALAADNADIEMLNALRARENPQLYFRIRYLFNSQYADFDGCYDERTVEHIADAKEEVLDYFTDSFEIAEVVKYKDGSTRTHTFMFPYISKLLDQLITKKSPFTETALRKALNYNKKTYKKLCETILSVKNDEAFTADYIKALWGEDLWVGVCERDLKFFENGDIVVFRAFDSYMTTKKQLDIIVTNVPHATKTPTSPILKKLVEELNESYLKIKNLKEHLKEV